MSAPDRVPERPAAAPVMTKHCPRCDQDLPLAAFSLRRRPGDAVGRQGYCKICFQRYQRGHRHPEALR